MRVSNRGNETGKVNTEPQRSFLEEELRQFNEPDLHVEREDLFQDSSSGSLEDFQEPPKEVSLNSPTTGRVVCSIFIGMLATAILCIITYGLYMNFIKYPAEMQVDTEKTGLYCLQNYEVALQNMTSTGSDSYIAQEVEYANGNEDKIAFYKRMLATVKYTPNSVIAKNVFGNDLIDRKTDEVVYTESTVVCNEELTLTYIDYDKVKIDSKLVKSLMSDAELSLGDVDYNNKLIGVFCQYMSKTKDLPTKDTDYIPNISLNKDATYSVLPEEDIYIDKLLFSSKELYNLIDRFSVVAGEVTSDETIQPTDTWNAWNSLSKKDKETTEEPIKYNYKEVAGKLWCGTYYLQNKHTTIDSNGNVVTQKVSAEIGDGSFENPAGYTTGVLTSIYINEVDEQGNQVTNEYPIKVSLKEYGVSETAIKWFEGKDTRNRGIDITSEVQYCHYVFEITNLSGRKLTITDNAGICDTNANLAPRTGTIFGLTDSVVLKPDETGIIESWNRNTELNKKYVIWGADFARRTDVVWFRLLAGDIDDPSEDKGVTLNKTRNSTSNSDIKEDSLVTQEPNTTEKAVE